MSNAQPAASDIWLVEKKAGVEFYSNGLRIEGATPVSNRPRSYQVANRVLEERISQATRSDPAGIVFHTTESHLAPFESGSNRQLKRIGEELLRLVRQKRSYHFVIDRFGRVFRIVQETDVAHHAGWSIWADEQWTYVNLNESFLGVAFESQSRTGDELPEVSPAQVGAARALVQMLRARYHIAAGNCVTHAQVSVNPDNRRIGYHTDWAGNFPYAELGLPDNYARPLASVLVFGFNYDPTFLASTGVRLWKGLLEAEESVGRQAAAQGLTVIDYKSGLQKKYRETLASLRTRGDAEEEAR